MLTTTFGPVAVGAVGVVVPPDDPPLPQPIINAPAIATAIPEMKKDRILYFLQIEPNDGQWSKPNTRPKPLVSSDLVTAELTAAVMAYAVRAAAPAFDDFQAAAT
jgi:hypothetical protein